MNLLMLLIKSYDCKQFTLYGYRLTLYYNYQSDFRQDHACQTALTYIIDEWLKHVTIVHGKVVGTVFLNFSKIVGLFNFPIFLENIIGEHMIG